MGTVRYCVAFISNMRTIQTQMLFSYHLLYDDSAFLPLLNYSFCFSQQKYLKQNFGSLCLLHISCSFWNGTIATDTIVPDLGALTCCISSAKQKTSYDEKTPFVVLTRCMSWSEKCFFWMLIQQSLDSDLQKKQGFLVDSSKTKLLRILSSCYSSSARGGRRVCGIEWESVGTYLFVPLSK